MTEIISDLFILLIHAEIIIGKHRNGATGKVDLTFQGPFLRFVNFAPEYYFDDSYGMDPGPP